MSSAEYGQLIEFLGRQFAGVDLKFADGDRKFDRFGQMIAELRQEMLGHFDGIYRRFERLENVNHAVLQTLRRIGARLAD